MNKIIGYIKSGRGIGAFLIFAFAFIISAYYGIVSRQVLLDSIPAIQAVADEILPLSIQNGMIVAPQNTIKEINLAGNDKQSFLFVLDTTQDSLNTDNLKDGIYLSRSHAYTVRGNEVKSVKFSKSFDLPQKDYTQIMQTSVRWFTLIFIAAGTLILFILNFIIVIFYTFCNRLACIIAQKNLSFEAGMRFNSLLYIALCAFLYLLQLTGFYIGMLAFFLTMIALQIILTKKYL